MGVNLTTILTITVWFLISALAVWQTVEILHHSQFGTWWRSIAKRLNKEHKQLPTALDLCVNFIGYGMQCPYCYSNWFGLLFMGFGAFQLFDPVPALGITFISGLAAARGANLLNDIYHDITRTPNLNDYSRSAEMSKQQEIPPGQADIIPFPKSSND